MSTNDGRILTGISNASVQKRRDPDNPKESLWDVHYEFEYVKTSGHYRSGDKRRGEVVKGTRNGYEANTETFTNAEDAVNRLTDVLCVYQYQQSPVGIPRFTMDSLAADEGWNGSAAVLCKYGSHWTAAQFSEYQPDYRLVFVHAEWYLMDRVWRLSLRYRSDSGSAAASFHSTGVPFGTWAAVVDHLRAIPGALAPACLRELDTLEKTDHDLRRMRFRMLADLDAAPDGGEHPDERCGRQCLTNPEFPREVRHADDTEVLSRMMFYPQHGASSNQEAQFFRTAYRRKEHPGLEPYNTGNAWHVASETMKTAAAGDYAILMNNLAKLDG